MDSRQWSDDSRVTILMENNHRKLISGLTERSDRFKDKKIKNKLFRYVFPDFPIYVIFIMTVRAVALLIVFRILSRFGRPVCAGIGNAIKSAAALTKSVDK